MTTKLEDMAPSTPERGPLQALIRDILSPNSGVTVERPEADVPGYRRALSLKRYIDFGQILANSRFSQPLLEATSAILARIQLDSRFTTVMTHSGPAELFCQRLSLPFRSLSVSDMSIASGDFLARVKKEERVLFLTDVIYTGNTVQHILASLRHAGAIPVGVLCLLRVAPSSIRLYASDIPIHAVMEIPLDALCNTVCDADLIAQSELLYEDGQTDSGEIVSVFSAISAEVKRRLALHPEGLYVLSPRLFEELVASILKDYGFEVELTPRTRDGGRDVIAYIRSVACSVLTYIECKKYAPDRKVGVEIVRSVYGVHNIHKASKSLIVTTSFFTRDAIEEAQRIGGPLELKDYVDLKTWLARYKTV